MMFKVIVRNFFVCTKIIWLNFISLHRFMPGNYYLYRIVEKIYHNEEDTFIYVHGRGSCSRL